MTKEAREVHPLFKVLMDQPAWQVVEVYPHRFHIRERVKDWKLVFDDVQGEFEKDPIDL